MTELSTFVDALDAVGGQAPALNDPDTAFVVVEGTRFVSRQSTPQVRVTTERSADRLQVRIAVAPGAVVARAIHLCSGILGRGAEQKIDVEVELGEGARAELLAHCIFPNVERGLHAMRARVSVGARAHLRVREAHHHGRLGGMEVAAETRAEVGHSGTYDCDFSLVRGLVGALEITQNVDVLDAGVANLGTRVFGHQEDTIRTREQINLVGEAARSTLESRVVLEHEATAEVVSITHGAAAHVRGHMDCMELVKDAATASSSPIVRISHPLARITHEAAVGTIDRDQLETLMAHGLTAEQAIDAVVTGILRD
jgi:hypothetical protein